MRRVANCKICPSPRSSNAGLRCPTFSHFTDILPLQDGDTAVARTESQTEETQAGAEVWACCVGCILHEDFGMGVF